MSRQPIVKKGAGWLAVAALLCVASSASFVLQAHSLEATASTLAAKAPVPIGGKFTLQDTAGRVVTDQTYADKWQLVFFGFTSCPDVCSSVMAEVAAALEDLGADAARVQPIFISMDPEQDSAQRIGDYLKAFDRRIVGLRGTDAQTQAAVKAFHVYSKKRATGSGYTLDHSALLYLMKPDGAFGKLLNGDAPGHKLGKDLRASLLQGHGS